MMNRPALQSLFRFLQAKDRFSHSYLISIPAIYRVLDYEFSAYGSATEVTLKLCKWIYTRAEVVRRLLLVHNTPPPDPILEEARGHWTKVCISVNCDLDLIKRLHFRQAVTTLDLRYDIGLHTLDLKKTKIVISDASKKEGAKNIMQSTVPES